MIWTDVGIVISARNYGEKHRIVNIFTKNHGKTAGMFNFKQKNSLSILSTVSVEHASRSSNFLGFWKLLDEKQNWVLAMHKQANIKIAKCICFVLERTIPFGMVNASIFNYTSFLFSSIHRLSSDEAVSAYAYFEFMLLNSIGYGFAIDKCYICQKNEQVHYISPNTGHAASHECANQYANRLFEIPECWMTWSKLNVVEEIIATKYDLNEIRSSLNITGFFIKKNIFKCDSHDRDFIINSIAA